MGIRIVTFLFAFFCLSNISFGQNQECVSEPTPSQLQYLNQNSNDRNNWDKPESIIWLPVQNHIVRESNGSGGLNTNDLASIMVILNNYYMNANIQFYECNSVNFIDNSNYYNFNSSSENTLCNANDVQNVINVYYFNNVTSGSSSLCGYAYFPGGSWKDRIIMKNSCALNGSTLTHEFGHYLSLYHTHGTSNNGTTNELVNGSNCTWAGDEICDTPADPNLSGVVSSSCQYTGSATDANGQPYVPDPTNIMSYSRKSCRTFMSTGQYNRTNYSAINDRGYLSCSNVVLGCTDPLASNYNSAATIDDGSCLYLAPITINANITDVHCYGYSTGAISALASGGLPPYTYFWSQGSTSQTATNLSSGVYTVTVTDAQGQSATASFTVNQPAVININYSTQNSIGILNNGAISTNISGGVSPYVYYWYNAQNNLISNNQNLVNLSAGTYTLYVVDANNCVGFENIVLGNTAILPISVTANLTNIDCFGDSTGSIYLNITGGYPPYNYLWSNGSSLPNIMNLKAGLYSVLIIDSIGQSYADSFVLIEPDSISISYTVSNVTGIGLSNGSIDITPFGGTPPYTYYWNTNPTQNTQDIYNLTQGNYIVWVVDSNFCFNSFSINVGVNLGASCNIPPSNIYTYDIIDERAKIAWDNMNTNSCLVDKYRIRLREVGSNNWISKTMQGSGLCINGLNTTSKQILNLNPATTYEYKIKAWYCGGATGGTGWSGLQTFTTQAICPDITNLTVTPNPNNNTRATFCWDTTGTYLYARVKYRVDTSGSSWINVGGFGVYYPTTCKVKFGMVPGQNYRGIGRAFCDPNMSAYNSSWTPFIFWTQPGSTKQSSSFESSKNIVGVIDILGRLVDPSTDKRNTTLFFLYDDGTVIKRIFIE
ncbi:MAG: M43 family zinc metalloprotease [Bacteroidota bacterium]|nr:M43 family zinc metalloprotease [Bacteroidota bacterium]